MAKRFYIEQTTRLEITEDRFATEEMIRNYFAFALPWWITILETNMSVTEYPAETDTGGH
jgi:hypothetical protein